VRVRTAVRTTTGERTDTEEELHERLRELVTAASTSGIDIVGGWPVPNDDSDTPDGDVGTTELLNDGR
jgi:hypothetical protein